MDRITGACSVDKVSGMVSVREDLTPLTLEWTAIEQTRKISIPLNTLSNLQATKEGSPKMILRVVYREGGEDKNIKLIFTNRPTMNSIKDSLQTIVARQRTVIKDSPTPSADTESRSATPGRDSSTPNPTPSASSSTLNNEDSLTDAALLKNLQLQQNLLLEDRNLRNVFTQSVMNFKLSPSVFWATRLNQLRTYALTISQHRGPYNVLSTIRPVATSDNQVNVNVTRDTINEIFDTYPTVKKAFTDLVPVKFSEGEFWSRFFNSKLFRRLRGDKINTSNNRGDVVLDKYLYIDQEYAEKGEQVPSTPVAPINKFIDIQGNEEDNSQKLGNRPDITMRYDDGQIDPSLLPGSLKSAGSGKQENEMMILMKNMNKLSSKMVSLSNSQQFNQQRSSGKKRDDLSTTEILGFEDELDLHDLREVEESKFIKLNIDTHIQHKKQKNDNPTISIATSSTVDPEELLKFFSNSQFQPGGNGVDLTDTYKNKKEDIEQSFNETTSLIKQNFRTFKLINREANDVNTNNLVPDSIIQEIITYNMTIVEFLSHFWKIYLHGNNPGQLKKIYVTLKNCRNDLSALKERSLKVFQEIDLIKNNEKLQDKIERDFQSCIDPMEVALDKACNTYVDAVKAEQAQELNGNVSKRSRAARRGLVAEEGEAKELASMPKGENDSVKKSIIRTTIKNESLLNKKLENLRVKKVNKKKTSSLKHKFDRSEKLTGVLSSKIEQSIARAKYVQNARKAGWDQINKSITIKSLFDEGDDDDDNEAREPTAAELEREQEDNYVREFFGTVGEDQQEHKPHLSNNKFALLDEAEA